MLSSNVKTAAEIAAERRQRTSDVSNNVQDEYVRLEEYKKDMVGVFKAVNQLSAEVWRLSKLMSRARHAEAATHEASTQTEAASASLAMPSTKATAKSPSHKGKGKL